MDFAQFLTQTCYTETHKTGDMYSP